MKELVLKRVAPGDNWKDANKKSEIFGSLTEGLEYVFKEIMIWVKKGNKLPKIHLLGIGSKSVLMKFPAYSCDNTNWMSVTKFGNSKFLKIFIPRGGKKFKNPYKHEKKYEYNKLEDQRLLKKLVDHEIKRYKDLEKQITEFWQKRGIVFNG